MIKEYISKLILNLPDEIKNREKPIELDLVLDGGSFNGSYLVGALYFLKEMEKMNYVCVKRMSGCSIGSIVAFLYLNDLLDMMEEIYELFYNHFKKTHSLSELKNLKFYLNNRLPENVLENINGKLFICYNNAKKGKKIIKNKFKNVDELFQTIIKSSFVPFLIDGNIFFERKYIDGINPYIFENVIKERKILYLDLYGFDKISHLISVKNEKTNYHRILSGLLDIHNFFIKQSSTQMCSYVNEWTPYDKLRNLVKIAFERISLLLVYSMVHGKKYLPEEIPENVIYKLICKISKEIFVLFLEKYCL
jgi:hypothetical protein